VSGALFRPIDRHGNIKPARLTGAAVARIVKRAAAAAGLDQAAFSGHSLRAGLATAAAAAGAGDRSIQKQTGHKSRAMLDRYIRSGELFRDNAAGVVGL
jgi:integrase